jgi:hypothetical protein
MLFTALFLIFLIIGGTVIGIRKLVDRYNGK